MIADNVVLETPSGRPAQLASKLHLSVLIVLLCGMGTLGFLSQRRMASMPPAVSHPAATPSSQVTGYFIAMAVDLAMAAYCFIGVKVNGGTLASMTGGRWNSTKDLMKDVTIAVAFLLLWEGVAWLGHLLLDGLHAGGNSAAVANILPRSKLEILVWILLCATAGFCEELTFRGYMQKQFHAVTGSLAVAVSVQGVVFGITHGYQGWKNIVLISALGVLYGVLAAWRRNLRVNVISHAFSDMWEGWIKFLIFH